MYTLIFLLNCSESPDLDYSRSDKSMIRKPLAKRLLFLICFSNCELLIRI